MGALRQTLAILRLNLRSLPERKGTAGVIVLVVAGMVGVLVATLSMQQGMLRTFAGGAREDRAIIVSRGAQNEGNSIINIVNGPVIADASGIRRDAQGRPIWSGDYWTMLEQTTRGGEALRVTLRGVGDTFFELKPEVRLTEGRMFEPAVLELIVGRSAHSQFRGLENRRCGEDQCRRLEDRRRVRERRQPA